LEWSYPSAKALFKWRLERAYRGNDQGPILILQMGKVGSKSVKAGLDARKLDRPIYHSHFLSEKRTAETERQRLRYFRTDLHTYLFRPWTNQFVLQKFRQQRDNYTWSIITLTREPVARNISAFFENLFVEPTERDGEFRISSDYYGIEPITVSVDDVGKLSNLFFDRARHDSPMHFFDTEIKDLFGIDVIGTGFAIDKGYQIYKADRVELLVLRLEDLATCAGTAFREFLGFEDFQLINTNIGAKKVYAPLYDAFKKQVVVDSAYLDELFDSDYMRTFYSTEEIRAAKIKWLRQAERISA